MCFVNALTFKYDDDKLYPFRFFILDVFIVPFMNLIRFHVKERVIKENFVT